MTYDLGEREYITRQIESTSKRVKDLNWSWCLMPTPLMSYSSFYSHYAKRCFFSVMSQQVTTLVDTSPGTIEI
jgi:hypothetical protein